MAFADPQTVHTSRTVATYSGGSAVTLPRTGTALSQGEFASSDGNMRLTLRHQTTPKGRLRHTVRLYNRKVAADPLDSTLNAYFDMAINLTVDRPAVGYTIAEAKSICDALFAHLTASSGAPITQLLGGES